MKRTAPEVTVRAWLDSTQIPSPDHNGHTHIRYNHDDERYIGYTTTTRQQLQVYQEKGNLDHMAPTYLFVKRRGTVDRNPCSCCILLVKKTYWILPTGIYGTLSKDGMTT